MATLNLNTEEFGHIGMIWLFDQVMNPDQIQGKQLKDFVRKHGSKIKTPLMKYYLDTTSEPRVQYKRIKGVFDGSDQSVQQIRIGPDDKKIEKEKKEKKGIGNKIKKVLKKVLTREQLTLEDINILKEYQNVKQDNQDD